MALGAVLGAALTDHSARRYGLYIQGMDVMKQPGTQATYGVDRSTVEVIESGVGAASSMTFTIDDPAIAISVNDGDEVRFQDHVADVPKFLGWIQSWSYLPGFGDQGRLIAVTCIGVDIVLDWAVTTTALTFTGNPNPTATQGAVQSIVANAIGVAGLRSFWDGAGRSTQAFPTGEPFAGSSVYTRDVTIPAGTTIREAIGLVYADAFTFLAGTLVAGVTVDFYFGLRTFVLANNGRAPNDWTTMTVVDTSVGALVSENLNHETNAADIVRQVYVIGGNAAGTGVVSDGTGKPGKTVTLTDSTILTADTRNFVGLAYLSQFAVAQRGSFHLYGHTPVETRHGGGLLSFTNTRASQGAVFYAIGQIRKTFTGNGLEDWEVIYGGLLPSAIRGLRRLTREKLS